MIVALTVIVALLAIVIIALQKEVKELQDVCERLANVAGSETKLFDHYAKKIKKIELAQQEQLDRIVNLTAAVEQKHGDLKRWTYKNVNDIWYAIENPLTGSEEESEEVRS